MCLWAEAIGIINNKMSLISATDTELLNNQIWYLDKGWLVHLNQAHCVVKSLTRPWHCWKPPSCRLSKVTADSLLWQPLFHTLTSPLVPAAGEDVERSRGSNHCTKSRSARYTADSKHQEQAPILNTCASQSKPWQQSFPCVFLNWSCTAVEIIYLLTLFTRQLHFNVTRLMSTFCLQMWSM